MLDVFFRAGFSADVSDGSLVWGQQEARFCRSLRVLWPINREYQLCSLCMCSADNRGEILRLHPQGDRHAGLNVGHLGARPQHAKEDRLDYPSFCAH